MVFCCLGVSKEPRKLQRRRRYQKIDDKSNSPADNQLGAKILEENGRCEISSKESSSTSFLEAHSLPEALGEVSRGAVRINGDIVHATAFFELLFDSKSTLAKYEMIPKLEEIGFSEAESVAFSEVLSQFIMTRRSIECTLKSIIPCLSFFLEKAISEEDIVDFGFNIIDQNSDGFVSVDEISSFFDMFWNKKLENILQTTKGKETFQDFMEKAQASESLEFYLRMKEALKKPYLDRLDFEEIKADFFDKTSEKTLNLSDHCRNYVLQYKENPEILATGLVKSSVFTEAVSNIFYQMNLKVSEFSAEMLKSKKLASKLHEKYAVNNIMTKEGFQALLVDNLAVAEFLEDVRSLFLKARDIADKKMEERSLAERSIEC